MSSKTDIIAALPRLSPEDRAEVRAKLEELAAAAPSASTQMLTTRKAALQKLRELGGLRHLIPDPVTWQREMRVDRPLDRPPGSNA
jgi:hypothetical protein